MKLFECKENSWVRIMGEDLMVPPAAPILEKEQIIKFHHIDGMYSLCHDVEGNIVHLVAWAEVEPCEKPT